MPPKLRLISVKITLWVNLIPDALDMQIDLADTKSCIHVKVKENQTAAEKCHLVANVAHCSPGF